VSEYDRLFFRVTHLSESNKNLMKILTKRTEESDVNLCIERTEEVCAII
jgi:hypothetical protein